MCINCLEKEFALRVSEQGICAYLGIFNEKQLKPWLELHGNFLCYSYIFPINFSLNLSRLKS